MLSTLLKCASADKEIKIVSSSQNRSFGNPNTVTAPSGIQDGYLLVAIGMNSNAGLTMTLPSGFTERLSNTSAANNTASFFIATKVAASESGNYAFTWSASGSSNIAIIVYKNAIDSGRLIGTQTARATTTIIAAQISPVAGHRPLYHSPREIPPLRD
jgi:hypothetical protein